MGYLFSYKEIYLTQGYVDAILEFESLSPFAKLPLLKSDHNDNDANNFICMKHLHIKLDKIK